MKTSTIFMAMAAMALVSCSVRTEEIGQEGMPVTIHAWQEGALDTKTTLQNGGTQVYWEVADEIKVFFRGSDSRFVSQNTELATMADFTGSLNAVVGSTEGTEAEKTLFGLYPYRSDATSDGTSVTTTLPAEQTARAGSFAKNTHITMAQSQSLGLAFHNVTGGIRFSLTQEGIKSVKFEAQNGESIAGRVKLAFSNGVPTVQEVTDGESTITLTAPGGGVFETGKWYYIEAIPGTLSQGFKMTFYKASLSAKLTSGNSVTIKRGIYGNIEDADKDLIFEDSGAVGEAVDLGLSVKWASWNVGASSPEEYGDYFAWGETESKLDYDWATYKYCNGSNDSLIKYNTKSSYGTVDNKTTLEPEDDVAHVKWGGTWRMPTYEEWTELRDNCSWTWTNDYNGTGIAGQIVTSNKAGYTDKSIFLPAAGLWYGSSLDIDGSDGFFWSSSLNSAFRPDMAWGSGFDSDRGVDIAMGSDFRCDGQSVRPVTE